MKLVSSAKLRKAQKAIEGMRPYEQMLSEILSSLSGRCDLEKLAAELSETAATRDPAQDRYRRHLLQQLALRRFQLQRRAARSAGGRGMRRR